MNAAWPRLNFFKVFLGFKDQQVLKVLKAHLEALPVSLVICC
jgi:hypothetical protein